MPYDKAPGYYESRSNLGDGVPAFIIIGSTPRTEVMRVLGAPEVEALNGHWAYYESNYLQMESGAWVVALSNFGRWPVHNEFLFRRLLLRYDTMGTVTEVEFDSAQCADLFFLTDVSDVAEVDLKRCPMLQQDVAMRTERQTERMWQAFPSEEEPVRWFEHALWLSGKRMFSSSGMYCDAEDVSHSALLGVSSASIVFLPWESLPSGPAAGPLRIVREQIASVGAINSLFQKNLGIKISLADNSEVSIALCGQTREGYGNDKPGTVELLKLLAGAEPD
ncbi:MAG: hypothetical protein OEW68_11490 [Gammaproteobacteria bacterium]|nr:hypothetical protein [Gammaproteobacteria bacterium]MDH5214285.1 hypothetical protein [Gammaproteobacteria bacterium]